MFAIGHFGLGYLLGKACSKITHTPLNFPLLFTVSILPDLDLLFPDFLVHRGPTHSLFFAMLVFCPFFVFYGKKSIPYFVALLSHSLLGDIYGTAMGIHLFWPFSDNWVWIFHLSNAGSISVGFELALFAISFMVMVLNNDFKRMLSCGKSKIFWLIPLGSVLGPLLIGQINSDYTLPFLLVFPSLFYVAIFSVTIIGPGFLIKKKVHEE